MKDGTSVDDGAFTVVCVISVLCVCVCVCMGVTVCVCVCVPERMGVSGCVCGCVLRDGPDHCEEVACVRRPRTHPPREIGSDHVDIFQALIHAGL